MTALRITNFGGIVPRMAPRLLPDNSAQAAANASLLPGELRPMRKSKFVYEPFAADDVQSIFKADSDTWFVWPTANVSMERAPLEGETRYLYTGDGVPKITTLALGAPVGATGVPAAARTLGIPKPQAAIALSHSGGTGSVVSRFYVYTFISDWAEEGPESVVSAFITGKVDGTWSISGMDDTPPNAGTVTAAAYASGVVTLTLGTGNHYLRAGDKFAVNNIVGMTSANGVHTVVSVPAANQVGIALTTAQTYTSGGDWTRISPWGTCKKRIYRSSGTGGQFLLVADGVTGTTYSDTLSDLAILGDELISQAWEPPPATMTGLVAMQDGMLAGFLEDGRSVCFSEPFQPHAWPVAYQKKMGDKIVGIAAFDSNLGVATTGYPVVLSGSEPAQMSVTRHAKPFPCLSRRSVCGVGDSFVFAAKNGLARSGVADSSLFTDSVFTPEGWNALVPASMLSAFDGVKLYVCTSDRMYIMDMVNGGGMTNAYQAVEAVMVNKPTGDFYFAISNQVLLFDPFDTAPMITDWWSKEYLMAKPSNLGAAMVEYDEAYSQEAAAAIEAERLAYIALNAASISAGRGRGPVNGTRGMNSGPLNGALLDALPESTVQISFSFYADGKLIYTAQIKNQKAFTLPNGYKSHTFAVRVQANTQIRSIVVGDTPASLAQA